MHPVRSIFALGVLAGLGGASSADKGSNSTNQVLNRSRQPFTLTSDAGVDGGTLSASCTCDDSGASPALSWWNAPAGTKEFALMMTTRPGDGTIKWNWVLYSIPAFIAGLPKNSTGVGLPGANSRRSNRAYEPPCSQGPGPKLYTLTVYALSDSPKLPVQVSPVTGEVLTQAISSITLGSASLNLSYTRLLSGRTAK